ncbi:MAG TPA: hypothetical protein DD727_04545 [Clostridiales bacterium]|nr:hypothetical protein [Clostridiales bacterium]
MERDEDPIYTFELDEPSGTAGEAIPPREAGCAALSSTDESEVSAFTRMPAKAPLPTPSPSRTIDPRKLEMLQRLSSLKVLRGPVKNDFMAQAQADADTCVEEPADFVPFQAYWPSYEDMSPKQKRWYFYWRTQLRAGSYPVTDLAYIFVYVYELINGVGFSSCREGFVRLCTVWSQYRERYPALDRYLASWAYDFILVYCRDEEPGAILADIPDRSLLVQFPDYMLGEYLKLPDQELPVEVILRFSNYPFHRGPFCAGPSGGIFLQMIPGSLREASACLLKTTGRSMIDSFSSAGPARRSRLPFQNALYNGEIKEIQVSHTYYLSCTPLREFITSVIRRLENALRKLTGFQGRLRGIQLDPAVGAAVDRYAKQELARIRASETRERLEFDRERILKLIQDADIIRERLLAGTGEDGSGEQHAPAQDTPAQDAAYSGIPAPSPAQNAAYSKIKIQTEEAEVEKVEEVEEETDLWANFLNRLDSGARNILYALADRGYEARESDLENASAGQFLGMLSDKINDLALELLGDLLILTEGVTWSVIEDYRDPLGKALQKQEEDGSV